ALAKALRGREITVRFVCRELPGNLNDIIQQEGFPVTRLPVEGNSSRPFGNDVREWLGVPQEVDAIDTRAVVEQANAGVLIVDHYSIDTAWEAVLASTGVKMVAIDDLANRRHVVDVLVDPGVGRRE